MSGNVYTCQSYALLVLQRSLGGACLDTDADGICDDEDNCPAAINPGQADADADAVGDTCDRCPGEDDDAGVIFAGELVCPSVCAGNQPPSATCEDVVHVLVDDQCAWSAPVDAVSTGEDPDGHRVVCGLTHDTGAGLGLRPTDVTCRDECGADARHPCHSLLAPVDETAPVVDVGRPSVRIELEPEWVYNWQQVEHLCEITAADNCSTLPALRRGLIDVRSDDPLEIIEGQPGALASSGIATDWAGFMLNLSARQAGPRGYTLTYAVGDESENWTEVECEVEVAAGPDAVCDGLDADLDGRFDEDYVSLAIACGVGVCQRAGRTACVGGVEVEHCIPGEPGEASEVTCDGLDNDCDGDIDEGDVCDHAAPTIDIQLSRDVAAPGEPVTVTVLVDDDTGVDTVEVRVDDQPAALDANHQFEFVSDVVGLHRIDVHATDLVGNAGDASRSLWVEQRDAGAAPSVALATPEPAERLFEPTVITGSVIDDDVVAYRLWYSPAASDDEILIANGADAVVGGPLGELRAGWLPADVYDLILEAEDAEGQIARTVRRVVVEASPRLGVRVACTHDLAAELAGRLVSIERCHDSADATEGEFGRGNTLRVAMGHVAHDQVIAEGWSAVETCVAEGPDGCVEVGCAIVADAVRRTLVTRDLDRAYTFVPEVVDVAPTADGCAGRMRWTPDADTPAGWALTPLDGDRVVLLDSEILLRGEETDRTFEAARFDLRDPDGARVGLGAHRLEFYANDGGRPTVILRDGGITHAAGDELAFERDAAGRITAITDASGEVVTYRYDVAGDLVEVIGRTGGATTYVYDAEHRLQRETDPTGQTQSYEYDAAGRLVRLDRADGTIVELAYDLDARQVTRTVDGALASTERFDASGRLVEMVDALGRVAAHSYDLAGQLVAQSDAEGRTTRYAYDDAGHLTGVEAPSGATRSMTWNGGDLVSIIDERGSVFGLDYDDRHQIDAIRLPGRDEPIVTLTYDSHGRPAIVRDVAGRQGTLAYDELGRLAVVTEADGGVWRFGYDSDGRLASEEDPTGAVRLYAYDNDGNLTSATDSDGTVRHGEFDAAGRLSAFVDRSGLRHELEYDAAGRLREIQYPDGTRHAVEYDAQGRRVTSIDAHGGTTTRTFDAAGHPTQVTYPDGSTEGFEFDATGQMLGHRDANGGTTGFERDAGGRTIAMTRADGSAVRYEWSLAGDLTGVTDGAGHRHTFGYDALGALTAIELPDGSTQSLQYDEAGRATSLVDATGRVTDYTYDAAGRVTGVARGEGVAATHGYDLAGRLTSVTDGLGHTATTETDAAGRPVRVVRPGGLVEQYEYDAAGRVVSATRPSGASVSFTYDGRGRVTRLEASDGQVFTITPAGLGDPIVVSDVRGDTTYIKDAMGRLLSVTYPDGAGITYAWDPGGNLTERTAFTRPGDPGRQTRYGYDALDRMTTVTDSDGGVTTYTYDARDLVTAIDHANGTRTEQTHDAMSRPVSIVQRAPDGTATRTATFERDAVGRVVGVETLTDAGLRSVRYTYDAAGRLSREQITDPAAAPAVRDITYTYDAASNLIAVDDSVDGRVTYVYDENDRLISSSAGATYTWDDDGNLIERDDADGVTSYRWDAIGRLESVERPDGSEYLYAYDMAGNRVARTDSGGQTVRYLVDTHAFLSDVLETYRDNGEVIADYTYGLSILRQKQQQTVSYYHQDPLGTVVQLTGEDGSVTDRYAYFAHGTVDVREGLTPNPYQFVGQSFDADTGLVHMRAREYDPTTRRFISPDRWPVRMADPLSLNRYLYANGDPVNASDPSGHAIFTTLAIVALVGPLVLSAAGAALEAYRGDLDRGLEEVARNWNSDVKHLSDTECRKLVTLLNFEAGAVGEPGDFINIAAMVGGPFADRTHFALGNYDMFARAAIELNFEAPSIYGDVDVDWMLKVSAFGIPAVAGRIGGSSAALFASTGLYYELKPLWNFIREFGDGKLDFTSIIDESNARAPWVAAKWASGEASLAEIFRPALDICDRPIAPHDFTEYPLPEVRFASASQRVTEGDSVTVGVTLTMPFVRDITVPYTVTGTAGHGARHNLGSGVIPFVSGEVSAQLTFDTFDDSVHTGDSQVIIELLPTNDTHLILVGQPRKHAVTILDDDRNAEEAMCDKDELDSTINGGTGCSILELGDVAYTGHGIWVIRPGDGAGGYVDAVPHPDGTWTVGGTDGWRFANNCTQNKWRPYVRGLWPILLVNPYECPSASLALTSQTVVEGDAVVVDLVLDQPNAHGMTVPYTVSGSAGHEARHDLVDGTVSIPPGAVRVPISFSTVDDEALSWKTTVTITLGEPESSGLAYLGNPTQHSVTIEENDGLREETVCLPESYATGINCGSLLPEQYGHDDSYVYVVLQSAGGDAFKGLVNDNGTYVIGSIRGWQFFNNCIQSQYRPYIVAAHWPAIFRAPYACEP